MIAILPFIILWVRMSRFGKLTLADLPRATEDDLQQMRKASKTAFFIMLGFTVLSFFPYFGVSTVREQDTATDISLVLAFAGLITAAIFDLKAERIKKRCRDESQIVATKGDIRWYHVVVAIVIPYVGLPWGIINLVLGRRSSGLLLTILSACLLALFFLPILLSSHPR